MPSEREQSLLLRRFAGINLTQDSAFVDPSFLQSSSNWVTTPTFLLSKRLGTTLYKLILVSGGVGAYVGHDALVRTYNRAGTTRYLYGVALQSGGNDGVWVTTNDGAPAGVPVAPNFISSNSKYGAAVLGERVYFGNGTDAIKYVDIGGNAADFSALASYVHVPPAAEPVVTADAGSLMPQGVYSFRWAVYNTVTGVYTSISGTTATAASVAHTVNFQPVATSTLGLVAPTAAELTLGANEVFRLFVAPRGLPIEFAHCQGQTAVNGTAAPAFPAGSTITLRELVANTDPIPLRGINRTGKFLLAFRGRLWVAGDDTNAGANNSKVYATSVIVPGLEQTLYNTGQFFPLNAVLSLAPNDGDFVTGIGIAAVTDSISAPNSPFLAFKNNSTWALTGDIMDDDSSQLVQLSSHIGCISHRTIVNTPVGTIWCGPESVYLIRPDLTITDIGFAITAAIRSIPQAQRANAIGIYHKGYYKLAFSPFGGSSNTSQLWLDLRYGIGNPPSWWGPHQVQPYNSWTAGRREPTEDDVGYAVAGTRVVKLDQANVYTDHTSVGTTVNYSSQAMTKAIDSGAPFERKLLTRIRANGRTGANSTTIGVQVTMDGGMAVSATPMEFTGSTGASWNSATWNVSTWGSYGAFHEGESVFAADRPRGQYAELALTHSDSTSMDMRDFELRYIPIDRPVGPGTLT